MANANELTYGVEIECYVPRNSIIKHNGSHNSGPECSLFPAGWVVMRDGSLECSNKPRGYKAVEIVSPILKGEDGLAQVVKVADTLIESGAKVNVNCGIHIHVDGSGFEYKAKRDQLVDTFKKFEKVFYSLCGSRDRSRFTNVYCKNSSMWHSPERDRFQSLNLTNLGKEKNTIEFRLFSGTLEAEEIVTAIFMTTGLVAKVSEMTTGSLFPNVRAKLDDFVQWIMTDDNCQVVKVQSDVDDVLIDQAAMSSMAVG